MSRLTHLLPTAPLHEGPRRVARIGPRALVALALLLVLASGSSLSAARTAALSVAPSRTVAAQYDWPQFNLTAQHSGDDPLETAITPATVRGLRRLFTVALPAVADGAPAYLSAVNTPRGVKDVLYVTTRSGDIIALDAHTGAQYWIHHNPAGSCTINNGGPPCYTTASPAIDPNRQYVYSYGLDGSVHKYTVGAGTEITTGGWPELATRKPFDEKGSADLSVATDTAGTSYLYVANGGYPGDQGDYQGHVTAINLSSGAQQVFNAVCSNQSVHFYEKPATPDCGHVQAAIWARSGVVYDPDTDKIYMATGNGTFAPSGYDWGDSVFALHPDGTGANGAPLDSYTPTDYQYLQQNDLDLGSTAPALLPVPPNSAVQHLAVQGGKDGTLRLLNLDNLSGQGGPGHTGGEVQVLGVPQGNEVLTALAVWVNPADSSTWVFVANDSGLSGLRLNVNASGAPSLQPMWTDPTGGTSPIVANGVLFYAGSTSIQALNPLTGHWLWHDTSIGPIHWESPIVANGTLYITDERGHLSAYGLLSGNYSATISTTGGSSSYTITPGAGGTATFGSCAVSTGDVFTLYVYDGGGNLLGSGTSSSYCNWVSANVNAGLTYTVKTVAAAGAGLYRSSWNINGAQIAWNTGGTITVSGGSSTVSFPTLSAGNIALSTCGPSGTTFDLYLTDPHGTVLASSTAPSNCQSLSYTPGTRGLFRLKEVSVSGTGAWTGTITTY